MLSSPGLSRSQLGSVVDAEDRHPGVIAGLDSMHHDVGQAGHDEFPCTRKRAFAPNVWIDSEELNRFAYACADLPRGIGISFGDILGNSVEVPSSALRVA